VFKALPACYLSLEERRAGYARYTRATASPNFQMTDPFALLAMPDTEWPPGTDHPVTDAVRCFDPANPLPLLGLLQSSDLIASRRGLRVFADLGRKGRVVLDEALKLSDHPDEMARNALMNGVMCYSNSLSASQSAIVLQFMNDPFSLVRESVVVYLAHADRGALDAAITSLEEPLWSEHRQGFEILHAEYSDPQQLFDEAVARNDIWSAYAFASLIWMARKGALTLVPGHAGEDFVADGVIFQIKRHIARRDGIRRGREYYKKW
jgi:hypothetical protein